jgi:soluble lytic murein transglycosylase
MSSRAATGTSRRQNRSLRRAQKQLRRDAAQRRRRGFAILIVLLIVAGIAAVAVNVADKGYRELALPLRHDDIIRQQAKAKNLDPALIAAVIYQESRFRPRESSAGALGLMQLLPDTAHFIAGKTGGTRFTTEDLATPQINIQYGAWYLRWLLDHFDGDETTALAAYNAGIGNVEKWLAASGNTHINNVDEIPFAETRHYVRSVLQARDQYRREYARELGLD